MPRGKSLAQMKPQPWIRIEVWGEPKVTKTSWALTAPTPIDFFAYDIGFELLIKDIDRLTKDGTIELDPPWDERKKEIYPYVYAKTEWNELNKAMAAKEMATLMGKFASDFQDACEVGKKGSGGTIVLDGGTQLNNDWTFRVDAEMENFKAQRMFGSPWAKRNAFFKAMMDLAKGCNRHLIVIHHDQEVWTDGKPTGEMKAAGDRLVEREVDLIMRFLRKKVVLKDGKGKTIVKDGQPQKGFEMGFRVNECRPNSGLRDMDIPWMPFDGIYSLAMD